MTSFYSLSLQGATRVIQSSLQQSPKVVNAGKAFYAAESAVESALYEASARDSGYEVAAGTTAGDSAFVPMERINKTEASWSAQSRLGMEKIQEDFNDETQTHPYKRVLFIPPRRTKMSLPPVTHNIPECDDLSETVPTIPLQHIFSFQIGDQCLLEVPLHLTSIAISRKDKRPFLLEEELPALREQSTMEKLVRYYRKMWCDETNSAPVNGFCPEDEKHFSYSSRISHDNLDTFLLISLFRDFEIPFTATDRPLLSWRIEAKKWNLFWTNY